MFWIIGTYLFSGIVLSYIATRQYCFNEAPLPVSVMLCMFLGLVVGWPLIFAIELLQKLLGKDWYIGGSGWKGI